MIRTSSIYVDPVISKARSVDTVVTGTISVDAISISAKCIDAIFSASCFDADSIIALTVDPDTASAAKCVDAISISGSSVDASRTTGEIASVTIVAIAIHCHRSASCCCVVAVNTIVTGIICRAENASTCRTANTGIAVVADDTKAARTAGLAISANSVPTSTCVIGPQAVTGRAVAHRLHPDARSAGSCTQAHHGIAPRSTGCPFDPVRIPTADHPIGASRTRNSYAGAGAGIGHGKGSCVSGTDRAGVRPGPGAIVPGDGTTCQAYQAYQGDRITKLPYFVGFHLSPPSRDGGVLTAFQVGRRLIG